MCYLERVAPHARAESISKVLGLGSAWNARQELILRRRGPLDVTHVLRTQILLQGAANASVMPGTRDQNLETVAPLAHRASSRQMLDRDHAKTVDRVNTRRPPRQSFATIAP